MPTEVPAAAPEWAVAIIDDWQHGYGPCPHQPKTRVLECDDCLIALIAAAFDAQSRQEHERADRLERAIQNAIQSLRMGCFTPSEIRASLEAAINAEV